MNETIETLRRTLRQAGFDEEKIERQIESLMEVAAAKLVKIVEAEHPELTTTKAAEDFIIANENDPALIELKNKTLDQTILDYLAVVKEL